MLSINGKLTQSSGIFLSKLNRIMSVVENALGTTVASWALHHLEAVTPVDTGTLKSMWIDQKVKGGVSVGNVMPYAPTLEEGLYTKAGAKTIDMGNGIYSTQAKQGMITPMVENPDVLNQISILVIEALDMEFANA